MTSTKRSRTPLWLYHQKLRSQGVTGDDYYELMVEKIGRSYPELAHMDPDEAARIALRHEGRVLLSDNRIVEADPIPLAVPDAGPEPMEPLSDWATNDERVAWRTEKLRREVEHVNRLGERYVTRETLEDGLDEEANDAAWIEMVDRADGYPAEPYSGPTLNLNFFDEGER